MLGLTSYKYKIVLILEMISVYMKIRDFRSRFLFRSVSDVTIIACKVKKRTKKGQGG